MIIDNGGDRVSSGLTIDNVGDRVGSRLIIDNGGRQGRQWIDHR